MIERKYKRYDMLTREEVKTYIQLHENSDFSEIKLFDVSSGGACLVIPKETFVQKSKKYPLKILLKENGFDREILTTNAVKAWYLYKEFEGKEMMYLGVAFSNEVDLKKLVP